MQSTSSRAIPVSGEFYSSPLHIVSRTLRMLKMRNGILLAASQTLLALSIDAWRRHIVEMLRRRSQLM